MIGQLTGQVAHCDPGEVVLDVSGVGYEIQIPLSTFYALRGGGGRVTLHVHTHVREDTFQLFGFATRDERGVFERLISVSGVGPRTALAVLSGIEVADLERAVRSGDRARLERVPGIGRKTAERILLELRDGPGRPGRGRTRGAPPEPPAPSDAGGTARGDALSALENLGYGRDAAERAVDAAMGQAGPSPALEVVLRAALRGLMR